MLILTRKKGQSIIINDTIELTIVAVEGDQIKIGVKAPNDVPIFRKEVLEAIQQSNMEASRAQAAMETFRKLMGTNNSMKDEKK